MLKSPLNKFPLSQQLCHLVCPDLRQHWTLMQWPNSDRVWLCARQGQHRHPFSQPEGQVLRYFVGQYTVQAIQHQVAQALLQPSTATPEPGSSSPQEAEKRAEVLINSVLAKLLACQVLVLDEGKDVKNNANDNGEDLNRQNTPEDQSQPPPGVTNHQPLSPQSQVPSPSSGPHLKPHIQWFCHPDGHWILRNGEDRKFMQLNAAAKAVADDLGQLPVGQLLAKHQISQPELIGLLQQLAQGSMLEGVPPPKRPKRKFTPLQLLFFKVPLFDPDPWLGWPAQQLGWLWTQPVFLLLCFGLGFSALVGFDQRSQLLHMGAALTQAYGATLFLPFGLLAVLVVTLHELGHALTLKHYGGIVPQMGLLFMMLLPAAYTDTTDQYFLTRRRQRILVVAAGVIVQLLVAAIALWLWKLSAPNSWLHPTSYLLLVAALFTLALNLNPLARFDGYYFMVAVTGINCLKDRAIKLYTHWFAGRPSGEQGRDRWILATYAPFSLLYTLLIFGSIVLLILHQFLANAPVTLGLLLAIWAIYYFLWPDPATQS